MVALQECARTDDHDDAADLLGDEYQTIWHSHRSDDGVGAVLGSRHPIRLVSEIDLRVTPRVTLPWAAAVLVEIELPPPLGRILVAHHKPTYEHGYGLERELQAVACARAIDEHLADHNQPAVVLGDFDDTPDSASLRFWTGRQSCTD
jgi:endonuclease/exonuclease/phosphatase family metal-dependent hydrolase